MDIRRITQNSVHRFLYGRIEMDRVDDLYIVTSADSFERKADAFKAFAKILAAMTGNADQALVGDRESRSVYGNFISELDRA